MANINLPGILKTLANSLGRTGIKDLTGSNVLVLVGRIRDYLQNMNPLNDSIITTLVDIFNQPLDSEAEDAFDAWYDTDIPAAKLTELVSFIWNTAEDYLENLPIPSYQDLSLTFEGIPYSLSVSGSGITVTPYDSSGDVVTSSAQDIVSVGESGVLKVKSFIENVDGTHTYIPAILRSELLSSTLNEFIAWISDVCLDGAKSVGDFASRVTSYVANLANDFKNIANQAINAFSKGGIYGLASMIIGLFTEINTVTVQDGALGFTDNSLYKTTFYLSGMISKFASTLTAMLGTVIAKFNAVLGIAITAVGEIVKSVVQAVNYDYDTATLASLETSTEYAVLGCAPYAFYQMSYTVTPIDTWIDEIVPMGGGKKYCCIPGSILFLWRGADMKLYIELHPMLCSVNFSVFLQALGISFSAPSGTAVWYYQYAAVSSQPLYSALIFRTFDWTPLDGITDINAFIMNDYNGCVTSIFDDYTNNSNGFLAASTEADIVKSILKNIVVTEWFIFLTTAWGNNVRSLHFRYPYSNHLTTNSPISVGRDPDEYALDYLLNVTNAMLAGHQGDWTVDTYVELSDIFTNHAGIWGSLLFPSSDAINGKILFGNSVVVPSIPNDRPTDNVFISATAIAAWAEANLTDQPILFTTYTGSITQAIYRNRALYGSISALPQNSHYLIKVPKYDRTTFLSEIIGFVAAAAIGTVVVSVASVAIKRAVSVKLTELRGQVEHAWTKYTEDPTSANAKMYRTTAWKANMQSMLLGGTKFSLRSYWDSGDATSWILGTDVDYSGFAEGIKTIGQGVYESYTGNDGYHSSVDSANSSADLTAIARLISGR